MSKKVALVGHCGPDSSYLRMVVGGVTKDIQVLSADDDADLHALLESGVDLLLFNREMPYGFSETEGVKFIERLRKTSPALKMILVSNYPEAQAAALAAGALPGFGKRELGTPRVKELLREALQA